MTVSSRRPIFCDRQPMPSASWRRWSRHWQERVSRKRSKISEQTSTVPGHPDELRRGQRLAVFQRQFREDLRWWTQERPRVADRIWALIEETMRTPFTGTGKPERLRFRGPD